MSSEQPSNPESAELERDRLNRGQASTELPDPSEVRRADADASVGEGSNGYASSTSTPVNYPDPPVSSGPEPSAMSAEDRLVEQTKQQIRALVREIAQLAQSDIEPNDFFEGFLGRVVSALAAEGGGTAG